MSLGAQIYWSVKTIINGVEPVLRTIDAGLVWYARLFGANVARPRVRYLLFGGVYLAIYITALAFPLVSLAVLAVGYVGVLAVSRAWVNNEKHRAQIAKQLVQDDPDRLPDLRGLALFSALQLAILFPMIFWRVQQTFGLYDAPAEASIWIWVPFTFDSVCKALLDWSEVYLIHYTDIQYVTAWGAHLVMLKRLTFDLLLIQAIIRLWNIRGVIRDAVSALPADYRIAVRLGKRAVAPLAAVLRKRTTDTDACVAAVKALGELDGSQAVRALMRALDHPSSLVRSEALKAIGQTKAALDAGPLLERLADPSPEVRAAAAEALAARNIQQAVEPLGEMFVTGIYDSGVENLPETPKRARQRSLDLSSPEGIEFRCQVAAALGKLGDVHAAETLLGALDDKSPLVAAAAAAALGELGDSSAVEPLSALLDSRHPEVRLSASRALGQLKNAQAPQPLLTLLRDEYWDVKKEAAWALGELGDPAATVPLGETLLEWAKPREIGNDGAETSSAGKPPAPRRIWDALRHEACLQFCTTIIEALAKLKDPRATEPLSEVVGERRLSEQAVKALRSIPGSAARLSNRLRQAQPSQKQHLVVALGKLGDPQALDPLIQTLKEDGKLARYAAVALGELGDRRAVGPLLAAADHPNRYVRGKAVAALGKIAQPEALEHLKAKLKDDDAGTRRAAICGLGDLGDPQSFDLLTAELESPVPQDRAMAAMALVQLGDRRAVPQLIRMAAEDEHETVRSQALWALGELDDLQAVDVLKAALKDPDLQTRETAEKALQKLLRPQREEVHFSD